jgi:hypothetical protein
MEKNKKSQSIFFQKYAAQGGNKFFFIVNIQVGFLQLWICMEALYVFLLITPIGLQVPGSTTYTLALYYMMDTPLEKVPLLEAFVNGDDSFRNSRFKLIPYISKVPIFSYKSFSC